MIGFRSFANCDGLSGALLFTERVKEIAAEAFRGCTSVTSLSFPSTLERIGDSAFMGCSGITGEVVIPEGVKTLEGSAFYMCTLLERLTLPEGLTVIHDNLVGECPALMSVNLPDSIVEIEKNAFLNCTSLTSIVLPEQLKVVEDAAFSGCTNLSSIAFSEGIQQIGANVFTGCSSLNITTDNEILGKLLTDSGFSNVMMQDGTRPSASYNFISGGINYHIFDPIDQYVEVTGCSTDLTSVVIPATVESNDITYKVTAINTGAFYQKTNLASVTLSEEMTAIGTQAFYGCTSLNQVNLPISLKRIGKSAFAGCTLLNQLDLPEGLVEIDAGAFMESGISNMTLPTSLDTITFKTFEGCTNLTSVEVPQNIKRIEYNAFSTCSSLSDVNIKAKLDSVAASAFDNTVRFETNATDMQLLLVRSLYKLHSLPIVFWKGDSAIDPCGIAVLDGDCVLEEDVVIGKEGRLLIPESNTLTVAVSLENNGLIQTDGTLMLDGTISGNGYLVGAGKYIKRNVTVSEVEEIPDQNWTGSEIRPEISFLPCDVMGQSFVYDTENYVISYEDNINAGNAKVIISVDDRQIVTIPFIILERVSTPTPSAMPSVTPDVMPTPTPSMMPSATPETSSDIVPTVAPTTDAEPNPTVKATQTPAQGVQTQEPAADSGSNLQGASSMTDNEDTGNVIVKEHIKYVVQEEATITASNVMGMTASTVTIPDTVTFEGREIKVTAIEEGAFQNNRQIKKVVIGKNVQEIGDKSFKGCTKLTKISYSNRVQIVGKESFANCKKLKSVSLSNSRVQIGSKAFKNCKSLRAVTLGKKSAKKSSKVKKGVATNNTIMSAKDVLLPDNIIQKEKVPEYAALKLKISIGNNAFQNCTKLKKTVINCAVQIIGNSAFRGCKNLRAIIVRSLILKKVGKSALLGVNRCKLSVPKKKYAPYKKLFKNKGQGRKVIYNRV